MKYYRTFEQTYGGDREVIMNEAEILQDYWPYWYGEMVRVHGADSPLITDENCIDDWVAVNWAVEV